MQPQQEPRALALDQQQTATNQRSKPEDSSKHTCLRLAHSHSKIWVTFYPAFFLEFPLDFTFADRLLLRRISETCFQCFNKLFVPQ